MKKTLLFIAALGFNIFLSCQSNDPKNETYPVNDTTDKIENLNSINPDSVKGMSSVNNDKH